jgi:dTDP-4-dehydrorhamnose 3,5-epimerase-like enzyme
MNSTIHKIKLKNFKNNSGSLLSLQEVFSLINVKNSFIIKSIKNKVRGNHAHKKATQIIFCLEGKVKVVIKNSENQKVFLLKEEQNSCLFVPRCNWTQIQFLKKSIIFVLSSEKYSEREYIRKYSDFLNYKKK